MNYTTNYSLNLPTANDSVDVSKLSENFSKIDAQLKKNADAINNVTVPTDQTYKPTSSNPQSGKAVAEAEKNANDYTDELEKKVNQKNNLKLVDNKTQQITFKKQGDKLFAVTGTSNEITLNTIAYDGKTYRDIFITNNLTPWGNFESGIDSVPSQTGTPEIVSDIYNSGSCSLKCFGTTSQQLKPTVNLANATTIYVACCGKVDRYVQGALGIETASNASSTVRGTLNKVTNNFEKMSIVNTTTTATAVRLYVGSMSSANLDGYIDDVVFVDLSIFSTIPSQETMDTLYDTYIKIITGQSFVENEETFIISGEEIKTDDIMSNTSTNPVQNKVVKAYVDNKNDIALVNDNFKNIGFKVQGDKLLAVTSAVENDDAGDVSIDDVARDGKSYRDIFVNSNYITLGSFLTSNGFSAGSFPSGGVGGFIPYSAKGNYFPSLNNDFYTSLPLSLKIDTNGEASYIKKTGVSLDAGTYYLAFKGRVDNYSSGRVGIQLTTVPFYNVLNGTTSGFVTKSAITTLNAHTENIYVGAYSLSNIAPTLTAYLDDIVLINLTSVFGTNIPSQAEMDAMYKKYVELISSGEIPNIGTSSGGSKTYVIGEEYKEGTSIGYSDLECFNAFIEKMNEKAEQLGMTSTIFTNANGGEPSSNDLIYNADGSLLSGVSANGNNTNGNRSTSQDLVKMFVSAASYDDLVKVWNKTTKIIKTKNDTPKEIIVNSTIYDTDFSGYYIFGGKTGSEVLPSGTVASYGVVGEINDKIVVGVIMGANGIGSRFQAMQELFDATKEVIETGTTEETVTKSKNAYSCLLPTHNTNLFEQYPFTPLVEVTEPQVDGKDVQYVPASVTKVMTAMVMLDYIKDLDETIEFKTFDYNIQGSAIIFEAGDIITYRDALYAMMLPSSCMTAQCVARNIGKKILEKT